MNDSVLVENAGGMSEEDKRALAQTATDLTKDDVKENKDQNQVIENDDGIEVVLSGDKATTDDERERIREGRRAERRARKEQQRQRDAAQRNEIKQLRENQEFLTQQLAKLSNRSTGTEAAQLEQALQDAATAVAIAEAQVAEAVEAANGKMVAKANADYYAARQRFDALNVAKQRFAQAQVQRSGQTQQQQRVDPRLQQHYSKWVAGREWYDPRGGNQDSAVVLSIDATMGNEGWDPNTEEYWTELTKRAKQYLPHRFKDGQQAGADDDDDDDDDDGDQAQSQRQQKPQKQHKQVAASGGSEVISRTGGQVRIKLSPERVSAMKEAGSWDDPKRRARAIKAYLDYDKAHRPAQTN